MINRSREDYIRAIYVIGSRNGKVRNKDLAESFGLSKNTVSIMLSKLRDDGYVSYEDYGLISLTRSGRELARDLTQKHRLIERFLTDILGRSPIEVHTEAGLLEHDFSEKSIRAIKRLLHNPRYDPHGNPIYT